MTIAQRLAETTWDGSLVDGEGTIHSGSGALDRLEVTWAARTETPGGKTSPEELAAAAHASCFSMALALVLGKAKTPPRRLTVEATVTLDEVDGVPTIVSSALQVRGWAAGTDGAGFQKSVDEAAALCPISRLFAGAQITVEATWLPA
ncbi:OsmC family peroxiredoxin [Actinoplanes sp. KI2]|uniref:OsmC family peroxiredoxin n=1 Tax=Actinoplanes sp. KI2 TaxID=2983315 RepID=UPI0021D6048B|nr:OsmC family peroxiredoxin [Actinoplanes sp. KI2]MCU7730971.1 OsmC family peroxiredoxin [Actinoplanes sp. KI2]